MNALPHAYPTVVHMFADAVSRAPDREALVCDDDRLDYAAYGAAVAGLAAELLEAGATGERVAILLPNCADLAIAIYASLAAGAQTAPLNPAYTLHELRPILADAAPRIILATPDIAQTLAPLLRELGLPAAWEVGPGGRRLTHITGDPASIPLPDPDALGILQYTGGTTGRPKGVSLTHRACAFNIAQREALVPTAPDAERVLVMTPLYHVYATAMGLYLAAYARGAMVLMSRYRPELALAAIARERITFLAGSPTIYHGLLAAPDIAAADFSTLSICFSGASALPAPILARWREVTGCAICEGFGQTEAGPVLAVNPRFGVQKPGSVGLPLPQTQIRIVDPATGEGPLPAGEAGEICAKGPQIMLGYRNMPQETEEALRDGWLHTGDIGSFDEEGYLFIQDRKKDMVVVSGFNVFPREIEDVLYGHPLVAEAAVFGVPDARKGEAIHVHVVPAGDGLAVADLTAFLAERLVRYKQPSSIAIVAALPKTAIGKIDKAALRAGAVSGERAAGLDGGER